MSDAEEPLDLGAAENEEPLDLGAIGTAAEDDISAANNSLPDLNVIIGNPEAKKILDKYLGLVSKARAAIDKLTGKPIKETDQTGPRQEAYDYLLGILNSNAEFFHDPKYFSNPDTQATIKDFYFNSMDPMTDIEPTVNDLLGEYFRAGKSEQAVSAKPEFKGESPEQILVGNYEKAKAEFTKELNALVDSRKNQKGYSEEASADLKAMAFRIINAANIGVQFMSERTKKSRLLSTDLDAIEKLLDKYKIVELERALFSQSY